MIATNAERILPATWDVELIRKERAYGVYSMDSSLWEAMDGVIRDTTLPLKVRVAAILKIDEIVGEESPTYLPDLELVNWYIAEVWAP